MVSGGVHGNEDLHLIKQDDKFFSRLLSKESAKNESSFRFYYCGGSSGSIPFHWESQPGTPKHTFSDTVLPPLTPPPSYQSNSQLKSLVKQSKPNFFFSIFPKISSKRITTITPSITSHSVSSSCSSSFSMSSMPIIAYSNAKNHRFGGVLDVGYDHDQKLKDGSGSASPNSTLCFGSRIGNSKRFRVYYPVKNMKKALLAFVGHGAS